MTERVQRFLASAETARTQKDIEVCVRDLLKIRDGELYDTEVQALVDAYWTSSSHQDKCYATLLSYVPVQRQFIALCNVEKIKNSSKTCSVLLDILSTIDTWNEHDKDLAFALLPRHFTESNHIALIVRCIQHEDLYDQTQKLIQTEGFARWILGLCTSTTSDEATTILAVLNKHQLDWGAQNCVVVWKNEINSILEDNFDDVPRLCRFLIILFKNKIQLASILFNQEGFTTELLGNITFEEHHQYRIDILKLFSWAATEEASLSHLKSDCVDELLLMLTEAPTDEVRLLLVLVLAKLESLSRTGLDEGALASAILNTKPSTDDLEYYLETLLYLSKSEEVLDLMVEEINFQALKFSDTMMRFNSYALLSIIHRLVAQPSFKADQLTPDMRRELKIPTSRSLDRQRYVLTSLTSRGLFDILGRIIQYITASSSSILIEISMELSAFPGPRSELISIGIIPILLTLSDENAVVVLARCVGSTNPSLLFRTHGTAIDTVHTLGRAEPRKEILMALTNLALIPELCPSIMSYFPRHTVDDERERIEMMCNLSQYPQFQATLGKEDIETLLDALDEPDLRGAAVGALGQLSYIPRFHTFYDSSRLRKSMTHDARIGRILQNIHG